MCPGVGTDDGAAVCSHSGQYVTVTPFVTVIMVSIEAVGQSSYVTVTYETGDEEASGYADGVCAFALATAMAAAETCRTFILKIVRVFV